MDEQTLLQHAACHGGFLTTRQARAFGCTDWQVHRLLRERGWRRPYPEVLTPPHGAAAADVLRLRSLLELRPHLVASHRTAARGHALSVLIRPGQEARGSLEVTDPRPGRSRTRVAGVCVHRLPLADDEVVLLDGVRATSVPRTLADLLRTEDRKAAVAAMDSALHRGLCSVEEVRKQLAGTVRHKGTSAAHLALALADGRSESPLETEARLLMHGAGLHSRPQAEVATAQGSRRVDFLFEPQGLAIETDGAEHHWTPAGQERDLHRFNELAASPDLRAVLRFTWSDVFLRPEYFLRTIVEALEALD